MHKWIVYWKCGKNASSWIVALWPFCLSISLSLMLSWIHLNEELQERVRERERWFIILILIIIIMMTMISTYTLRFKQVPVSLFCYCRSSWCVSAPRSHYVWATQYSRITQAYRWWTDCIYSSITSLFTSIEAVLSHCRAIDTDNRWSWYEPKAFWPLQI